MTTSATIPVALTRTNVTKDDDIWKRESPNLDNNNNTNRAFRARRVPFSQPPSCSPPLKHITVQSTQELLDNFDPLDVLDSASERSASSADTMIMMTTEEERTNDQRIRNSFLRYESNKAQLLTQPPPPSSSSPLSSSPLPPSSFSLSSSTAQRLNSKSASVGTGSSLKNCPSNSYRNGNVTGPPSRPSAIAISDAGKRFTTGGTTADKPSPLDDGYSTDSRSNTSASTSSPLSSSFSSLSTFEGSFHSTQHNPALGSPAGNPVSSYSLSNAPTTSAYSPSSPISPGNMQRNIIVKGHSLSSNGPRGSNHGHQRPAVVLAAKRRDQQPVMDSSPKDAGPNLEERLRALTTIEEEESVLASNILLNSSYGGSVGGSDKMATASVGRSCSIPQSFNANFVSSSDSSLGHFVESSQARPQSQRMPTDNSVSSADLHLNSSGNGFFRAVPVAVVASPTSPLFDIQTTNLSQDGNFHPTLSHPFPPELEGSVSKMQLNPSGACQSQDEWVDYSRYFEKHSDIPLHNIASASGGGKFVNSSGTSDLLPDKDINKQIIVARSSHLHNQPDTDLHPMQQQQPQHHHQRQQQQQQHNQHQQHPHSQEYQQPSEVRSHSSSSDRYPQVSVSGNRSSSTFMHEEQPGLHQRHAIPMSLSEMGSRDPSWSIESGHSSLPVTINQNGGNYEHQYNSHDSVPAQQRFVAQHSHHQQQQQQNQLQQQQQQNQLQQQQQQNQLQQQQQQQQQHQQQQQQQTHHRPNGEYMGQSQISFPTPTHEHDSLRRNQPPVRRTSRDEFISLSRSLSKQYLQQSEMLQQQQQHQQHHNYQQQQPLQQHLSDIPFNSSHSDSHPFYSQDYPEVMLRNSSLSSSTRSLASRPDHHQRYSWQPSSSNSGGSASLHHGQQQFYDGQVLNSEANSRVSLDLGSIPQLQRQIRATSEMCLQMSKTRHKFASSADIYKLFQGQRRPSDSRPTSRAGSEINISTNRNSNNSNSTNNDNNNNMNSNIYINNNNNDNDINIHNNSNGHNISNNNSNNNNSNNNNSNINNIGRTQFHRHSFHSAPQTSWAGSHHNHRSRDEPVNSPRSGTATSGTPTFTSRPPLRIPSPALSNTGLSSNPGPVRVDHSITIPNAWAHIPPDMPRTSIAADTMLQFQRQSSGYSSENELQQIESNARAIRKIKSKDPRTVVLAPMMNPNQEFRPVNSSLDGGSSTGVEDDASVTDNEPVYVNQRMMEANSKALEGIGKSSSTRPVKAETPSPVPPKRVPLNGNKNDKHTNNKIPNSIDHSTNHQQYHNSHNPHHHPHSFQEQKQQQQQQQQHQQQTTNPHYHQQSSVSGGKHGAKETSGFPSHNHNSSPEGDKITQNQIINLRSKPVTIKSYVPSNSYSPVNGNDDMGHTSIPYSRTQQTKRGTSGTSPLFLNTTTAATDQPRDTTGKNIKPRTSSSSSVQLSPVDIAQMLEVPFATNIISDEDGDRLSTLV